MIPEQITFQAFFDNGTLTYRTDLSEDQFKILIKSLKDSFPNNSMVINVNIVP